MRSIRFAEIATRDPRLSPTAIRTPPATVEPPKPTPPPPAKPQGT